MNPIISAVFARLEAEKQEALAMCQVYMNNPMGVADHANFTDEAVRALKQLQAAEDAIQHLRLMVQPPEQQAPAPEDVLQQDQ
tara:strand:+ start:2131 stop:2379 length:249 start_codon:yes stop_codon:yes gene_type:complete